MTARMRFASAITRSQWPPGSPPAFMRTSAMNSFSFEHARVLRPAETPTRRRSDSSWVAASITRCGHRGRDFHAPEVVANSVCLIVVATEGTYKRFARDLFASADVHFRPAESVSLLMLPAVPGWPAATMYRYHVLLDQAHLLRHEYLFLTDADMRFEDTVGPEILASLVAVQHPGHVGHTLDRLPYERRPESTAYVARDEGRMYFAGGLVGGERERFLALARRITSQIDADDARGVTAVWHDESHLNRCLIDEPPELELSPAYCHPDDDRVYLTLWPEPYERRLVALDKTQEERGTDRPAQTAPPTDGVGLTAVLRKHRNLVGLFVGLPISALFLWLAVRSADPGSVRASLQAARLPLVALAVVAMLAVYGFQAVRWRAIARTPLVGPRRFYELVVSGVACNNVLPARIGDLLRARWLGREAQIPAGRALGTVVLDRGCDVVALFAFLAVGLVAVTSADWLLRIAIAGAVGLLALGALLVFVRLYTKARSRERRKRSLVRRVIRDTAEMLAEPLGRRRSLIWAALSLAAWSTWGLAAILIGHSVGIELGLLDALLVAGVMNLGVAIPSSPGFVGTYQWLGVASLGLLGVGADDALAFSILLHASWYVPTTVLGGALIALRTMRKDRRAVAA